MRTYNRAAIILVLAALAAGCASTGQPSLAERVVSAILPGGWQKDETTTSSFTVPQGFERQDVYRYKGAACEAADLSHDILLIKTVTGEAVFADIEAIHAATVTDAAAANIDELMSALSNAAAKAEADLKEGK